MNFGRIVFFWKTPIRSIRHWLWWKAYRWVFNVKHDIRWQVVNDRLMVEWRKGYEAGRRYEKTIPN